MQLHFRGLRMLSKHEDFAQVNLKLILSVSDVCDLREASQPRITRNEAQPSPNANKSPANSVSEASTGGRVGCVLPVEGGNGSIRGQRFQTLLAAAHRILSKWSQQFPSRKPQLCPQRCIRTSPSLITTLQLRGFEPRAANTTGIGSCGAAPKSLVSAASSGGRWEGVGNLHNAYGMGWDRMEDDIISMRLTSEGPERTAKCEIRNYLGAWPNTDKHPEKIPFSVYM
ncbi:hypothetical protein FB451DRAFT_1194128 [Mycena latifolia]|nr:hypothetical protein FB451DRAFT_1194128 [Mycena latifolia]